MASPQTTETTSNILNGAVKVEVSSTAAFTVAVDCGVANGVKLTETFKMPTLENDNAVDSNLLTDEQLDIEWEQVEILNEAALAIMRGAIDTTVVTAGTPVTNHEQEYAANGWSEDTFIPFDQISYSGAGGAVAVPTNIEITQDTAGTPVTLTADTDYIVGQGEDGRWGVFMVNNGTVDSTKDLEIEFDYTPKAGTRYYVGGGTTDIPSFYVRLTNIDETGKIVRYVTTGIGNITKGYEVAFKKYNADDTRVPTPIAVTVRKDITATAGCQLYYMEVIPA